MGAKNIPYLNFLNGSTLKLLYMLEFRFLSLQASGIFQDFYAQLRFPSFRARDIAPTSIRALYGISDTRNATHGSGKETFYFALHLAKKKLGTTLLSDPD